MYYNRIIEQYIKKYSGLFPAIGIMGPRQSGKTTTVMHMLGNDFETVFHRVMDKLKLSQSQFGVIYQGKSNEIFDEMKAWNYMEFLKQVS